MDVLFASSHPQPHQIQHRGFQGLFEIAAESAGHAVSEPAAKKIEKANDQLLFAVASEYRSHDEISRRTVEIFLARYGKEVRALADNEEAEELAEGCFDGIKVMVYGEKGISMDRSISEQLCEGASDHFKNMEAKAKSKQKLKLGWKK